MPPTDDQYLLALLADDTATLATLAPPTAPPLAIAAAVGDVARVQALTNATNVNDPTGAFAVPALVYACCAEHRGDHQSTAGREAVVAQLIALGADVNVGHREMHSVRGYRTVLGGAIGCVQSGAMAQQLIAAGADAADGPSLYEGCALWYAVSDGDPGRLQVLLDHGPPEWQLAHALPHALDHNRLGLVTALLDAGANPDWPMSRWGFGGTALHEAVWLDVSLGILEALLVAGASTELLDRLGQTPLGVAVRLGRRGMQAVLQEHGARGDAVNALDERLAEIIRSGDGATPMPVEFDAPNAFADVPATAPWLPRMLRLNRPGAALAMVQAGIAVDHADDEGATALHLAAGAADTVLCAALLDRGADVNALDFDAHTALDIATDTATATLLANRGGQTGNADVSLEDFEAAADAVVTGDLPTLRALLAATPQLARARSVRPHRATLLHYIGANGVEDWRQTTPPNAVTIAERLLAAGSDPNASCYAYRGGPEQTTMGLMLTSDQPVKAGLTLSLAAALAAGGAELSPAFAVLTRLHAHTGALAAAVAAVPLAAPETIEAFIEAVRLGEQAIVAALLTAGIDANATKAGDVTALHTAAINGDRAMVELLLAHGADPNRRDTRFNGNAAGWANAGGHAQLASELAARSA